jgi:hypothetical protein
MSTPATTSSAQPPKRFPKLRQQLCAWLGWGKSPETSGAATVTAPEVEPIDVNLPEGLTHQTFTHYVRHKDDLVGFVAYSIYKQHKISFLDREYKKTQQRATQDKVDAFCESYGNPEQVDLLRERAAKLIQSMNDLLLNQAVEQVRIDHQAQLVKKLKEGPGWIDSILKSVAGNLTTAALVALVIFGGSVVSHGFWETVSNWTGHEFRPKQTEIQTQPAS